MKRFNPEKELSKIKNGNKNKILYSIIVLLLIVAVGSTYALYQVRHSQELTHITVKQFYQNDLDLAVYVDGVKKVTEKEFPTKENGTNLIYTGIKCEDGKEVKASWNYDTWALDVKSKLPNKCNVYFETRWKDNSGASYPELYQGMIPITISDTGELTVADVTAKWYSYNDHEWANAILIDDTKNHDKYYNEDGTYKKNTTIPIEDVLQMYVWIPRYKYKLFNAEYGISEPQEIEIEFENNTKGRSMGTNNGQWYTHPAFLFGDTELNGIWVGKFEPSDPEDAIGTRYNVMNEITILPDKISISYKNLLTFFNAERNIEKKDNQYNLNPNEVDTHPMKNMEWGAVAYLTNSKYGRYTDAKTCIASGCEVWKNNIVQGSVKNGNLVDGGTYTGCVGENVSSPVKLNTEASIPAKCDADKVWTQNGVKASTTGNMYGIYDMAGGTWEGVFGVTKTEDGKGIFYASSGFNDNNMPDDKYYDLYEYSDSDVTHERGYIGDATRETLKILKSQAGSWNGDLSSFPYLVDALKNDVRTWFLRGGGAYDDNIIGVFAFSASYGGIHAYASYRSVLTAQDGEN